MRKDFSESDGMNRVYFLATQWIRGSRVTKRVTDVHRMVYHGVNNWRIGAVPLRWSRPALSNSNREYMHIMRSGSYVPPVFCPNPGELVISEAVADKCRQLRGIELQPVVFEHLVELPMPSIGDLSQSDFLTANQMADAIRSRPNEERFHETIGQYYYVLAPHFAEVAHEVSDTIEVNTEFGRFFTWRHPKLQFSASLSNEHSVYKVSGQLVLTEEAFDALAMFLDWDFFLIDFFSLRPRARFSRSEGIIFDDGPLSPESER